MGEVKERLPVKLVIGFIYHDEAVQEEAKTLLQKQFGKIDFESEVFAFAHTDYYKKEFGEGLKKKFISFSRLIPPSTLARIKLITNTIEKKISIRRGSKENRVINIDPGYIDLAKLVLASTKDYSHRLYLGQGIYAEVTLFYKDKTFNPWEWTYPDFRTADYISICKGIRERYVQQINER